jgi:hypothetical protein
MPVSGLGNLSGIEVSRSPLVVGNRGWPAPEEIPPWVDVTQLEDEEIRTIWPGACAQGGATVTDGDTGDDADSSDSGSDSGDDSDSSDSGSDSDSDASDRGGVSDSTDR